MLARERQNTIVEIVNREGSVRVKNLSKKFFRGLLSQTA